MGQISKALGMGAKFEYQGKEYTVAPWSYRVLGQFELYLQDEALKNCRRMRAILTDDEYKELVHRTKKDIDVGAYTFGTQEVQKALESGKHLRKLVTLCLQRNHSEVTDAFVEEMVENDPDKFNELVEKMGEANADPNGKAPKRNSNTDSSATPGSL